MAKIEGWQVFALNWRESERGMGQRDDGFSLHLTPEDAEAYRLERSGEGSADCYAFADFQIFLVIVSEAIYNELIALRENGRPGMLRAFPKRIKAGQFLDLR